jgi:hypothetical protein
MCMLYVSRLLAACHPQRRTDVGCEFLAADHADRKIKHYLENSVVQRSFALMHVLLIDAIWAGIVIVIPRNPPEYQTS